MLIKIDIKEKRAQALGSPVLVCGNTDNVVEFTFDEEWAGAPVKTARFVYIQDGAVKYTDVVFNGNRAAVPLLSNTREVRVGVFSGELITTTPAVIPCELSILCRTGTPEAPTPSQYDQIMALLNSNQTLVNSATKQLLETVTDLANRTEQQLAGKSDKNHNHDDVYCSVVAAESLVSQASENVFDAAQELINGLETDMNSLLAGKSGVNHTHDDKYYTKTETESRINQTANTCIGLVNDLSAQTAQQLAGKSDKNHDHGDIYCSVVAAESLVSQASENVFDAAQELINELETDMNSLLAGKSGVNHTHDDRYYTEAEIDSRINQVSSTAQLLVTDLANRTEQQLAGKSDKNHNHDDVYCSVVAAESLVSQASENVFDAAQELINELETDMNSLLAGKSNTDHQHYYLRPQGGGNTVLVNSYGHLYPMVNEGQQLGTTTNRWSYILGKYVVGSEEVNGPIVNATTQVNSPKFNNTSDERVKENFDTDMAKYVAMLDLIEPTSYHFKSEADMEDRKRNVGYIAQRVQDAMAEVGLDDTDFGGLCYDTERESKGEFSYGLAYSQFIPILHAKLKQLEEKYDAKIAEYDKKIAELEALLNVKE